MHTIFLPRPSETPRPRPGHRQAIIAPPHARIKPTPMEQWPLWARAAAKFRRLADTGLGDTIVHLIGDTPSAKFKKWFQRKFGRSCGCTERQRWLNQKFPYPDN